MAEKCGRCGSTNLGADKWDIWHYKKACKDCGATTRYNRKGKVMEVKGGNNKNHAKLFENNPFGMSSSDLKEKERRDSEWRIINAIKNKK